MSLEDLDYLVCIALSAVVAFSFLNDFLSGVFALSFITFLFLFAIFKAVKK